MESRDAKMAVNARDCSLRSYTDVTDATVLSLMASD